jgi:hypothetical protein
VIQDAGRVDISGNLELALALGTTANYDLSGGELSVGGAISFGPGTGTFNFTGGTLHVGTYNGDLVNGNPTGGGILAPGNSAGHTDINGNYYQHSNAVLQIEIGGRVAGDGFVDLAVDGIANLAGILDVSLIENFAPNVDETFTVLTADSIVNSGLVLGGAAASMFELLVGSTSVILQAIDPVLPGDFNNDDVVDAADYVAWRKNPRGEFTPDDYNDWYTNFGVAPGSGIPPDFSPPVPEPSSAVLALLGGFTGFALTRQLRRA